MVKRPQNEYIPESVSLPGETLQEALEAREMSQVELAERMGRPVKTINEIIKGKAAITPDTALQLERTLGVPASFWTNLERNYQEFLARVTEREQLAMKLVWLKKIPVAAMARLGWIERYADKVAQLQHVLDFFAVASPEQWEKVYTSPQAAFRRSTKYTTDPGALAAWLRQGEIEAAEIACEPYSKKQFRRALQQARSLTVEPPETFQPQLIEICAQAGVAVVFEKRPPKTPVSGATKWLSPRKALVQLSLRFKSNDHLWFSFFHEAGHILLHGKKRVFLEWNGGSGNGEEEEADRFAADFLIPPEAFKGFSREDEYYSKSEVVEFAESVGVAPGIVVGRMQHEGLLPMSHMNDLKLRLEWEDEE